MIILEIVTKDGERVEVTAQDFKYQQYDGATIVKGDKYYIDAAVKLGATKPTKAKK